jgi:cytochrome c
VDSFELNKIMAAILIALLVAMIACLFGDAVVVSDKLLKNVYVVDTQEDSSAVAANQEKSLTVIEPMLASADVINGEKAFKKCLSCHTVGKGEPHKTGPNLWNIVMGYIASDQTFAYSDALRSRKEQWSYENLNKFLYKPREFAPGTKMTFIGISNDQERADLIAFLRKNADNPVPLP